MLACARFLCCSHRTVDIEPIDNRVAKLENSMYYVMRDRVRIIKFIENNSIENNSIEKQMNELQSRMKILEGQRRRASYRVYRENTENVENIKI